MPTVHFNVESMTVTVPEIILPDLEQESEPAIGHYPVSDTVTLQGAHKADRRQPMYIEATTTVVDAVQAPPVVDGKVYDEVAGYKNSEVSDFN